MRKHLILIGLMLFLLKPALKADEGMWLPFLIENNYAEMKEMGLHLTPEQIYDINNSSLKDAIVIFGRGCTAEVISDQGLILTNHHCGYGVIQSHSTVEHDYLSEGFWAMSKEEELTNEGLTVSFLVRVEDVTDKILSELNDDMTEEERRNKVREVSKKLQDEATKDTHYDASVETFFKGNEYYMFIYEIFRDVRLVGAPPSSIGKFGADTDNWMWPRHTGDFSLFRVYAGKDGKPADYSEDNVPLTPRHHLPISIAGVEKGDFTMIMGYPGSTQRYLTSYGVDNAINVMNPTIVDIREKKLEIMRKYMDEKAEVRIQYASKYARVANYWKYFIGQTKGLKRLKVAEKKKKLEQDFRAWLARNPSEDIRYGEALTLIKDAQETLREYMLSYWYFREAAYRGAEIMGFAARFGRLKEALEEDAGEEKINAMVEQLKETTNEHFKDYHQPIDREMLAAMMEMYYENVPKEQQPDYLKEIASKYKGDFSKYADKVFSKSSFADKESVMDLLENPKAKTIDKDMAYEAYRAFMKKYRELNEKTEDAYSKLGKGRRYFVAGLRKMQDDKNFYPDANFTMRLTYGTVEDYYPSDAVHYNYFTTLEGVMEKEDPENWEFVVPEKLKELYQEKDYGPYDDGGVMKVGFITTHDITGGNSGSPVINGYGELVGLAFDGNWEAMSGDIAFEPQLQRTINVDVRYVLFVIDKYAGAKNIIEELDIVKKRHDRIPEEKKSEAKEMQPEEVEN